MDERRPGKEASQHVILDIHNWLESVKDRAGMSFQRMPRGMPAIFRVPRSVRRENQHAYEPNVVSIGPYHRCKSKDFMFMEEIKWRLLHEYLSKVPNGSNNEGLREWKDLEMSARNCYSEVVELDSDQFVEMLLLDGCFLVQIFIAFEEENNLLNEVGLSCNRWFRTLMLRDLLLLENQIPYFILQHLLDMLGMPEWNSSRLQKVAISCFESFLPLYSEFQQPELPVEGFPVYHLLDLFHRWISSFPKLEKASNTRCLSKFLRCGSKSSDSNSSENFPTSVPTMTQLAEAGVKIEVRESSSFQDISFCKDQGVLGIPAIKVDDRTNTVFANLIALEQSSGRHKYEFTVYTMFLDSIVDTSRDVQLLCQKKIIHRLVGEDNDIASLFNKLGKDVVFGAKQSYLHDVYLDLNAFCGKSWPKWRAKAVRDYFNNPWAIISFGAAVLLLGLTILQTVYTVLDHYDW